MIKGLVLDAISKQPLDAVSIYSNSSKNEKAITDDYGHFKLKTSGHSNNVTASHIGYKTVSMPTNTTSVKITLEPDAVRLEDVKLAASGIAKFNSLAKMDLGIILKPTKNLPLNIAAWNLYLAQKFVHVGDDGNIKPSGKTNTRGLDIIARYQFSKYLFVNTNINFTNPRSIGSLKGEDYIPLAPTASSTGGLFYKKPLGFNGGISYRYIKSRPANEDNSIVAKGYFF